jgi:hypothetical protein
VYPVTGVPPAELGAVMCRLTAPSPGSTLTDAGALGTEPAGATVTGTLGSDGALVPARLTACTVNVYAVPSCKPGTTA